MAMQIPAQYLGRCVARISLATNCGEPPGLSVAIWWYPEGDPYEGVANRGCWEERILLDDPRYAPVRAYGIAHTNKLVHLVPAPAVPELLRLVNGGEA